MLPPVTDWSDPALDGAELKLKKQQQKNLMDIDIDIAWGWIFALKATDGALRAPSVHLRKLLTGGQTWMFCGFGSIMKNSYIGGWRAFFHRDGQFLLQKFLKYTTPKDGMEI